VSVGIADIANCVPDQRLTNAELLRDFPGSDSERLVSRTGVSERRIAEEDQTALDLAERACRMLIEKGSVGVGEIDAIIFCTQTPDYVMPPNACLLHGRLNLGSSVMAFDTSLACSGYVYGLQIARGLVSAEAARTVLLVTGDTYSRLIGRRDRSTRGLFGDGAAVSVIRHQATTGTIKDIVCATSGAEGRRFWIPAGGTREPLTAAALAAEAEAPENERPRTKIQMDGFGVLSFFSSVVPKTVAELLQRNAMTTADIDLFVFHQASRLALESLQRKLAIDDRRFVIDMDTMGNLVSASIPVALERARAAGRVKAGSRILLCGFGVGLSWGAALLQY